MRKLPKSPFITLTYDEHTWRHHAGLNVINASGVPVAVGYKWLTAHESEELQPWISFLDEADENSYIDVSVAEILEHQENGDIQLDDESYLLELLQEAIREPQPK